MSTRTRHYDRAHAFTLVEVVVVVVVLSVLAGVIVPRIVSKNRSQTKMTLNAVRTLLSAAAQRDALTSQAVAIRFDAESAMLSVLTPSEDDERRRGDDLWPWRVDPLILPVRLDGLTLQRAAADSLELDDDQWILELARGERRPDLTLECLDDRGRSWVVFLPSGSSVAKVWSGESAEADRMTIDLDEEGRGQQEW